MTLSEFIRLFFINDSQKHKMAEYAKAQLKQKILGGENNAKKEKLF